MTKGGRQIVILTKKHNSAAREAGRELQDWLVGNGFSFSNVTESEDEIEGAILGVAIGGDGTFLNLFRRLKTKNAFPLLGINLGTLGFITETSRSEMFSVMKQALSGALQEQHYPLLNVEFRNARKTQQFIFFNDLVITREIHTPIVPFEVRVDGSLLTNVRADGFIISTALGSTGYALSMGGPLVHFSTEATILVPLCGHSLTARPVVVPSQVPCDIAIKDFSGTCHLVLDGQVIDEVKAGATFRVTKASQNLRIVGQPKQRWADILRDKLKVT